MSDTTLRDSILEILEINRDDLKTYGVESISLFGSVARGDSGPRRSSPRPSVPPRPWRRRVLDIITESGDGAGDG